MVHRRHTISVTLALCAAGLSTAAVGCGDDSDAGLDGGFDSGAGLTASATNGGDGDGDGDGDGGGDGVPPPEEEEEGDFRLPEPSDKYVYSASESTDRVAAIDTSDLSIDVVDVCRVPTVVAAIPGQPSGQGAVAVLCQGSGEVAFVRTESGQTSVELRPVTPGANALSVSPDGAWVIAYHDIDGPEQVGPGSDQEVTALPSAEGGSTFLMTVGVHPRDLEFRPDGSQAFVVTDDGVSVITMAEVGTVGKPPLIPVVDDPGINPATLEIEISVERGQALARTEGGDWLVVTDLSDGAQTVLDLPGFPTDLDVAPDGTFAIMVLPDQLGSSILEIPLPIASALDYTEHGIGEEYVGLVDIAPDGQTVLLYTTQNPWGNGDIGYGSAQDLEDWPDEDWAPYATGTGGGTGTGTGGTEPPPPTEPPLGDPRKRLTIARRDGGGWQDQITLFTEAPVRSVGVAPDSQNAILLHDQAPEINPSAPWPYTLLDISVEFPIKKIQTSTARPGPILFTPDSQRAAIRIRSDAAGVRRLEVVELSTFIVDELELASPPEGLSYVRATDKLFVSQEHPSGRITFIDGAGGVQTVTGYELNDSVKD